MTIQGISTNVHALLDNMGVFATVLPHPPSDSANFTGYPAVCHYYNDAEANYATVSQNRRVYEYFVEIVLMKDSGTSTAEEFSQAYELIDNTMQMFDESIDLSSEEIPLSRACDIMRPTPGRLERVEMNEGLGLLMTLRLYCEADVTFR